MRNAPTPQAHSNEEVLARICELYHVLFRHDGFGELRVELRLLKRGQKEIILHCGKQYRYVVDYSPASCVIQGNPTHGISERG